MRITFLALVSKLIGGYALANLAQLFICRLLGAEQVEVVECGEAHHDQARNQNGRHCVFKLKK